MSDYELSRRDEAEIAQCEQDIARVQGMITELNELLSVNASAAIDWLKDAIAETRENIGLIRSGKVYRGDRANTDYENARAA